MGNTDLRPDEASRIEHRDVAVILDADTNEPVGGRNFAGVRDDVGKRGELGVSARVART